MVVTIGVIPGMIFIIPGEPKIIGGILFLGLAALIAFLSAKDMNRQKSIDAFLAEVDSVGNRDSVLAAIDAQARQTGFLGIDVRFHSNFIAYKFAKTAHIWKTADIVWMYIQQKNIAHKKSVRYNRWEIAFS